MRYLKKDTLYCFSPAVMLATFFIEIVLALVAFWRYRANPVGRLATVLLVCLAIFQLAEYSVCSTAIGLDSVTWARVGYVAITLLPPMGLQMTLMIAGKKQPKLIAFAYASAVLLSVVFLFSTEGVTSSACLGNYVIFEIARWVVWPFAFYYYGWLLLTIWTGWRFAAKLPKRRKLALYTLSFGYLTFIVPTTFVNIVDPSTIAGIPSIMCGFAVILALLLVGVVLPETQKGGRRGE